MQRQHDCHDTYIDRWIMGNYSSCSVTCGGGSTERDVYCARPLPDSETFERTSDNECAKPKPAMIQSCNTHSCPTWFVEQWSPVGGVSWILFRNIELCRCRLAWGITPSFFRSFMLIEKYVLPNYLIYLTYWNIMQYSISLLYSDS